MKKRNVLIGVGIGLSIAVILTLRYSQRNKFRKKLDRVSEEGYETAPDILYPGLTFRRRKLYSK